MSDPIPNEPVLSSTDRALYRHVLSSASWTVDSAALELSLSAGTVQRSLDTLTAAHLVSTSPSSGRYYAVSPDSAAASLAYEREAALVREQMAISQLKSEILSLSPDYSNALRGRELIETVYASPDVVRRRLRSTVQDTKREVLVIHPGGGLNDEALEESIQNDLSLLERGVSLRIVLQHAAREHLATQRYAAVVCPAGADIRTVPLLPRRLLVFDAMTAFIPSQKGVEEGALIIKDAAMLAFVTSVFEVIWSTGRAYSQHRDATILARGEFSGVIMRLLAKGLKDEVIARRLGVSVRTCRRHIARLMADLGAESRFQAGILAAELLQEDLSPGIHPTNRV